MDPFLSHFSDWKDSMKLYEIIDCQWNPKPFYFEEKLYQGRLTKLGEVALKRCILRGIFKYAALSHCRKAGMTWKADCGLDFVALGF